MKPKIFTIDPQTPFLDVLAAGLWEQAEGDGLRLSEMLVLLPTRRACKNLGAAFARLANGKPSLLPRMRPLGEIDEDEMTFADEGDFDLPPAIAPMRRLMLLTQLVQKRDPSLSSDQAALAARALAKFLDQTQIERCDLSRLPTLVRDEELAKHWQQTVQFLEIVTQLWPAILRDQGCLDPAERRNAVLAAQCELWRKSPPVPPIIAAGSTGSVPATSDLLNVIANLPQGAVILPGLDTDMDAEAWDKISDTHPQHSMKRLLEKIGIDRQDVSPFAAAEQDPTPARLARRRLISESMRPAELTDRWRALNGQLQPLCAQGLTRLTLDHPQEEAQVIALRLRQALEDTNQKAALVTADRGLALRVAYLLQRWGIDIDDSGGAPFAALPPGAFLNLILSAAAPAAGHVDHLAMLKHPFAACGLPPAACRDLTRKTELALRHGKIEGFDSLEPLLHTLSASWNTPLPLTERIDLHIRAAEAVAASDSQSGQERLWRGEMGSNFTEWLDEWRLGAEGFPPLDGSAYAALFASLCATQTMRKSRASHPRLSILGPLEARLLDADLVILGGMNEGVWPPDPGYDPWMSRPMRKDFGLPAPEFRIGLSAHDFAQLCNAPEVFITRSSRDNGTPTAPTRFLLQIEAVLRAAGLNTDAQDALAPAEPWREWARLLDTPDEVRPCERPRPCPPADLRPQSLSVTKIGTWLRNPYAIYAEYILGLKKLDELDAPLDASDRGTLIHEALERYLRTYADAIPADALEKLRAIGAEIFARHDDDPRVTSFWQARFAALAEWFVEQDTEHRADGWHPLPPESEGRILIDGFTLRGRADRIDKNAEGQLAIIDYKTGQAPKQKEIDAGIEPQAQLLALIAERGGFANIAAAQSALLEYWELKGGADGGKISKPRKPIPDLIAEAEAGLRALIAAFADPAQPYEAVPRARFQPKFNDYAHLARLAEWGRTGSDGE